MKKLILVGAFLIGACMAANAQMVQKTPEQRAAHMTRVLQKRLNLNAEQAQQVNSIFYTRATRMDSLKSNLSADKRLNHQMAKRITYASKQNLLAVLNPEQQKQFAAWEQMHKQRHQEKSQSVNPGV